MQQSFVYALTWNNQTKIGFTSNPTRRFSTLCSQAGVDKDLATFSFYETINPRLVEKLCHKMAGDSYKRITGEWFLCSHAQAVSIILVNVISGEPSQENNPRLERLLGDMKTSLTAGIASVISSDFKFNDTEFGDLNVIQEDDENWFLLDEVMSIIGYDSCPSSMVGRIANSFSKAGIKPIFHKKIKVATKNGLHSKIIINEQGLFELLAFGNTTTAIRFRSWVINNILTGVINYNIDNN